VANGDVVCCATARACLERSGAAAVMVGRAAVGQPWVVGEIAAALEGLPYAPPSWAERAAAASEHYESMLSLYGVAMGVRHARKHLAGYAERSIESGFSVSDPDRRALVTSNQPDEVFAILGRLYAEPVRLAA
jgi:tRNA-dihydrouridine synthase